MTSALVNTGCPGASTTDLTCNGLVNPGDTIRYTVTVNNTAVPGAGNDAAGLTFTDTLPSDLALVAGSLIVQPIAAPDSYPVTGNVRISSANSASLNLLSNDIRPQTGLNTSLTVTAIGADNTLPYTITTSNGGQVTANANDGTFSYDPAPGFEGTDSFTYTITDTTPGNGLTATGTATLTVSGMIWFVNAGAAAGGDGRLSSPFNCLVGAGCYSGAASDPNDNIFLYSGAYTGGVALKNGQKVVGQGATTTLAGITGLTLANGSDPLPALSGARPTVTTSAASTSAFTLATSNTLRGFDIGNTTASDITGAGFGTLTASEMALNGTGRTLNLSTGTLAATFDSLTSTSSSGGAGLAISGAGGTLTVAGAVSITGASTQGISISNSTLSATFGSTSITSSTTQGILVSTHTLGTLAFGSTTVSAGTIGVSLQNNASGSRTFGTLNVSGGTNEAFSSGGGGGNATVSGAASLSSAGNAIDIDSLASGSTVTFSSNVSATRTAAGGVGVDLTGNTGSTITFNSLAIDTNAGTGLNATGGGTINVTNNTGGINTTPEAAAAIIANSVTLNANFASIASSGGTNGVSLTSVSGTSNFGSGSLTGASGSEFLISGGNPSITYAGSITQNNAARVVDIQSTTGGTVTFNTGTITGGASSTGVVLNSDAGNVGFANLNLGTSGSRMGSQAITITGGAGTKSLGAVSVFTNNAIGLNTSTTSGAISSSSGEINATGAAAVSIAGTSSASRTPLNIQLTKVNSTGSASNGIIIQNTSATGSPGGFRILGNTAGICGGSVTNTTTPGTPATVTAPNTGDCSGGTVTAGSDGIRLVSVENVSLTRMFVTANGGSGIFGTEVNGFIIDSSYVFNNGNSTNEWGLKFQDTVNPGTLNGLVGSATNGSFPTKFLKTTVRQNAEFNVGITNRSGVLTDLLVDGCQFTDTKLHASGLGADGFESEMQNTASATFHLQNSFFSNNFTQGAQIAAIDSAATNVTISSSTITNNNEGFVCNHSGSSDLICTVGGDSAALGNTFASNTNGVIVGSTNSMATASASMTLKFKFNNVNSPASNTIHAIYAFVSGTGTLASIDFSNNTVVNNGAGHAILVDDPDSVTSSPQIQVTANNNNVTNGAGNGGNGVLVQARKSTTGCVLMQNNTGSVQAGLSVARVRTSDTGVLHLKQGVSASNVPATVIQDNNPGVTTSASQSAGTLDVVANNGCTTPTQRPEDALFGSTSDANSSTGQASLADAVGPAALGHDAEMAIATDTFEMLGDGGTVTSEIPTALGPRDGELAFISRPDNDESGPHRESLYDIAVSMISPTVYSQKASTVELAAAPEFGETVTVSGNGGAGFTLPAQSSFTITFDATVAPVYGAGAIDPTHFAVTDQGTLNYTNGPVGGIKTDDPAVGGSADATVTKVIQPENIQKVFNPTSVSVNTPSTLTFTVKNDNPAGTGANATAVTFTDAFPANLVVGAAGGSTTCTGGVLRDQTDAHALAAGDTGVKLKSASLNAVSQCTVTVSVVSSVGGSYPNTTNAISSLEGALGIASNTATLRVFTQTAAAVAVSGRVVTQDGRGVTNASVTITDSLGVPRTVVTGRGGAFSFDDVPVGYTYIVSAASQRFHFDPQVIAVTDTVAGLNFVAMP